MADRVSPEVRSRNMSAIRSVGTKPEMIVRRLVHSMGYRYRLHTSKLPGKPDLVFRPRQKVIFVHGCFWHQHADAECPISHRPRSNLSYWSEKLRRNVQRDEENQRCLEADGWTVLTVWECQTRDIEKLADTIHAFLAR